MKRTRVALLATSVAVGLAVLAACGSGEATTVRTAAVVHYVNGTAKSNNAPADTGDFHHGSTSDPVSMKWVQLSSGASGPLNPVVHDAAGFTLYRFDKDSAQPPTSTCTGACATTWPPVQVASGGKVFLDGVQRAQVGTITRPDGTLQVTIGGWPVYRYRKDTQPGQTNGQGVGGTWFGVTPTGGKAGQSAQGLNSTTDLNYQNGTAAQHNAPPNTGDFYNGPANDPAHMKWVQLTAGSANGLNPIVHNGVGFTLYRFDKDTAHPSASHCTDACAQLWPPVLVTHGSRIFVDGVETDQIGILTRPDGTRQVTIGGWPIYRYANDTAPGQTNGEGVGGTWFAISPTGGKVVPPGGVTAPTSTPTTSAPAPATTTPAATTPATTEPPTATSAVLGNGTVILDSGKDFTEPNGSEGIAGPGCRNLAQPGLASSLQLAGGPIKIWTGPNCTGTSKVVAGDVADLGTIGFDKKVVSIRFGG